MDGSVRRIALATCRGRAGAEREDRLLAEALAGVGIAAEAVVWDDGRRDWERYDACLIRSTWDYHEKHSQFLAWTREVAAATRLWNPPELVAWSSVKTYLRELEADGVPVVPTEWVGRGTGASLETILAARGWAEAVVKPAVDLGARNLSRVRRGDPGGQAALERVVARHEAMVQPFLSSVESRGELSLVYVEGALAHAVRKLPAAGEFRVQSSWGGTARLEEPGAAEREAGERALATLGEPPLYARVDLVEGSAGRPLLIELELVEPRLHLAEHPATARALAEAVARRLEA